MGGGFASPTALSLDVFFIPPLQRIEIWAESCFHHNHVVIKFLRAAELLNNIQDALLDL